MEDFGYIKGATGHRDILHMSDGEEGKMRGMKGGGSQWSSHGGSGMIKAEDGGIVLSPAVQLR